MLVTVKALPCGSRSFVVTTTVTGVLIKVVSWLLLATTVFT